jgi:2-methylcitrate dehydratase PrpD
VHVTLKDGTVLSTSVEMPVGSTAAPLSHEQLIAKFDGCANGYLSMETALSVKGMLANLASDQPIKSLMASLRMP